MTDELWCLLLDWPGAKYNKKKSFVIRNAAAISQCRWYILQRTFLEQGLLSEFILPILKWVGWIMFKWQRSPSLMAIVVVWATVPNYLYSPRISLADLEAADFGSVLPYLERLPENHYTRSYGKVKKRRRQVGVSFRAHEDTRSTVIQMYVIQNAPFTCILAFSCFLAFVPC